LKTCAIFRIHNAEGYFRLGITVKARCNSVERNRVKRRIRESFRLLKDSLGGYDYNVVVSDKRKLDFTYARQLFKELTEEFPRELHRFKATRPAV
jgi:ribonuclease P protein component